jgi:flagellar export protein FliJ
MKPLLFRAQAALDIRRLQDEAAQRALALAQSELLRADHAVLHAAAQVDTAAAGAAAAFAQVRDAHQLVWHRNWMVGLEREVARARHRREERRVEVDAAAVRAQQARRAVRVLERLRERAFRAWERLARREEQKALDLLGSLQYAARHLRREEDVQ